ncbi:MAG: YncE family protein [Thermoplasmata archaeon]
MNVSHISGQNAKLIVIHAVCLLVPDESGKSYILILIFFILPGIKVGRQEVSKRKKSLALAVFLVVISASAISMVAAYDLTLKYDEILSSGGIPGTPSSVAYDQNNGLAYVSSYYANRIFVVDGTNESIVGAIPAGIAPSNGIYDPVNGYVYFSNQQESNSSFVSSVDVVDSSNNSLIAQIPLGRFSFVNNIVVNQENGTVFVSANSIYEINGTHIVAKYGNNDDHYLLALSPNGRTMYMLSAISGIMFVTNMTGSGNLTLTSLFNTGQYGSYNFYLALFPDSGKLLLGTNNKLYVFNSSSPESPLYTIHIPNGVKSAYCSPLDNYLYLSFYSQSGYINVYNVSTGHFAGAIRMPSYPSEITDLNDSRIMVISGSYLYVLSSSLNSLQPNYTIFYIAVIAALSSSFIAIIAMRRVMKRTAR